MPSRYTVSLRSILFFTYSEVPNSSGVPNKCMVAYNFFDLLHKNARFWSFLAYFWFKINSRGATTIRQCRVDPSSSTLFFTQVFAQIDRFFLFTSLPFRENESCQKLQ